MARGVFPICRHDNSPWQPSDNLRAVKSGQPLAWRGAIIFIKGDWSEFSHSLGFTSWAHNVHPCFMCKASQPTLYLTLGLGPASFPHDLKVWADYIESCNRCEVIKVVSEGDRRLLLGSLAYDKRPRGSHGRCLRMDVCGLLQDDRLEPCAALPDIGALETVECPITLTFWRTTEESGVLHRNPLFNSATGVTPDNTICVDWLHNLSLGVFKDFIGAAVNKVVHTDNIYNTIGTVASRLTLSIGRLQAELFAFYSSEARAGRKHTRVQTLEASCFGKPDDPSCNLHGAEVNGVLSFVAKVLLQKQTVSDRQAWCTLATQLDRLKELIYNHEFNFTASANQDRLRNKTSGRRVRSTFHTYDVMPTYRRIHKHAPPI
jgi:hypothetical protein